MSAWVDSPHNLKWEAVNKRLWLKGYWVRWENSDLLYDYRYAIGKEGESKPMGVFEGEASALAVVKILLED